MAGETGAEAAPPKISCMALCPDAHKIATGLSDGSCQFWTTLDGGLARTVLAEGQEGGVTAVGFTPDGNRVAVGDAMGWVRVWDFLTGELTTTLDAPPYRQPTGEEPSPVHALAFAPQGVTLGVGYGFGVRLWDYSTGSMWATLAGAASSNRKAKKAMAWSPNGARLAVGEGARPPCSHTNTPCSPLA